MTEAALLPREPSFVLRCCLCRRPVREALELLYGPVCRPCLQTHVEGRSLDDLAALFSAAVVVDDLTQKEVFPCSPNL